MPLDLSMLCLVNSYYCSHFWLLQGALIAGIVIAFPSELPLNFLAAWTVAAFFSEFSLGPPLLHATLNSHDFLQHWGLVFAFSSEPRINSIFIELSSFCSVLQSRSSLLFFGESSLSSSLLLRMWADFNLSLIRVLYCPNFNLSVLYFVQSTQVDVAATRLSWSLVACVLVKIDISSSLVWKVCIVALLTWILGKKYRIIIFVLIL